MTNKNNNRGKFITIEGSEGVGKSTNITFIKDFLAAKGIDLLMTREPGGTPLAEEIRALLLQKRDETMDETAELLLMFAARSQHLKQVILPALSEGKWVLCDRFTDSTYAYQGGGRGLDQQLILQLEKTVQKEVQPDITFYLDIDVKLGLARASQRAALDRFESEEIDFFERVRTAYLERARSGAERYKVVDAGQTLECVQTDIKRYLEDIV
ncbi:MAG: dTMP kinase [Cellvibrionaceae bacterium]